MKCHRSSETEKRVCPYDFGLIDGEESGCEGYIGESPHGEKIGKDGIRIISDFCIFQEWVEHEIVSLNHRGKFEFDSEEGLVMNKNWFPVEDINFLKIVKGDKETVLINKEAKQ